MDTTRRDLFKFAGGAAAGFLITPAPWRLVTDAALWSENWPGIPKPARGEIRTRFTHCALCPAGCAVRARCVDEQPVALAGLSGQPLCAFGLTGHQLPYHAGRIKEAPAVQAAEAVARRDARGSIAVLDLRPDRTASWIYRRAMAALGRGLYLAPRSALPAVNLQNVRTILSFGVPVLDGWGTPARVLAARAGFRLIQAEPRESHTAMLADLWLPIRPGSEQALARGVTYALQESKVSADIVEATGVPEQQIVFTARELAQGNGLVLGIAETPEILELNRLAGGLGKTIIGRRETPVPESWKDAAPVTPIDSVPDHSIGTLLIDEIAPDSYLPWEAIAPKLATGALVVTFASTRAGYGQHAQITIPTPVFPEFLDDIPPAIDAPMATFRLATPLVAAPPGVVNPAEFIGKLAGLPAAEALRERAVAIHATRRGTLLTYADRKSVPLTEVKAEDFWKALNEGGCWMDAPGQSQPQPVLAGPSGVAVVAPTWEMRAARGPVSPLLSKLYQESNLRVRS